MSEVSAFPRPQVPHDEAEVFTMDVAARLEGLDAQPLDRRIAVLRDINENLREALAQPDKYETQTY